MKKCFKCGELKPLSDFYKHPGMSDGRVNKCKECNKKDVRENRADKVEYYRTYDQKRFQEDSQVSARHRRYQQTDSGKESMRKSALKWQDANSSKRAANVILGNAVRNGKIEKPDTCSECGDGGRIHGHHEDYAYPMSVRWLCPACHVAWHRENGEGLNGQ